MPCAQISTRGDDQTKICLDLRKQRLSYSQIGRRTGVPARSFVKWLHCPSPTEGRQLSHLHPIQPQLCGTTMPFQSL